MAFYLIVETAEGLTVAQSENGDSANETATRLGAVVIDAGPFSTYEDAYDAMLALADEDDAASAAE